MMGSAKRGAAIGALALAMSACAPKAQPTVAPVLFPPAPAPPRIQYLTSLSGLKDIASQSSFNRFVAGERPDLRLDKPYGIAVHGGKIYVCDTNATVFVFDLTAKTLAPLKGDTGQGKLVQPINVSVDEDGIKYVADPVRGQVVAFDRNDEYLRAYGTPGAWRPVDAAAFGDRLYVADPANHLVRVFDKASASLVKQIGDKGEPDERLSLPTNLAFDAEGTLYVTDASRFQIVKFDRDGHFRSAVGKPGDNLGHFARPKGIALDREGRLLAVDASFNNVQIFNKDGRLLLFFGEAGDQPGNFMLPAKVTIDYDNVGYFDRFVQRGFQVEYLIFVTSQFGPRMVNVLAFGKQEGLDYPTDDDLLKQIEERRDKEREKLAKP
jgi:DNA-binding beta-propeller fold protein YncE